MIYEFRPKIQVEETKDVSVLRCFRWLDEIDLLDRLMDLFTHIQSSRPRNAYGLLIQFQQKHSRDQAKPQSIRRTNLSWAVLLKEWQNLPHRRVDHFRNNETAAPF